MTNTLNWKAYTGKDRNQVIGWLKATIAEVGGYIIKFSMFSDVALTLIVEIQENRIDNLYRQLKNQIKFAESTPKELDGESLQDWWVFITVSFSAGTGNLKIEVPDVPG